MRRAILVTTGAVVGVVSVVAYKPSERLGSSGLSVTALTPTSANTPSTTQTTDPSPASAATTAAPAATPTATHKAKKRSTKAKTTATHKAKATHKATAKATSTPTSTATSTPKPTAASGGFANADGTYRSSTQQVVSHGRYYGDATISVTVRSGRITAITFNETGGNFQFADAVNQYLVPEIIRQQKVSVGIVSGATGSSMALVNGLNSVLK